MTDATFRKYTNLPVLLKILNSKKITLSDPSKWEDKNDSYYIETYKRLKKYKTVLVSCFSEANETYHHWKIYAGSTSGICIIFHKDKLMSFVNLKQNILMNKVIYMTIKPKKQEEMKLDDLPFYKRIAFKDEKEFRFLYYSRNEELPIYDIEIELDCIKSIVINPWLEDSISNDVICTIQSKCNERNIHIYQSSLLENEQWKQKIQHIIDNTDNL